MTLQVSQAIPPGTGPSAADKALAPCRRGARDMKQAWARHYPETVLALVALATWWLMQGRVLPDDVGWQFWTARQMLGGTRLYDQLWEVNPPLWFWSAIPLEWMAERTGIVWGDVLAGAVVMLGAGCAWLTAHLLETRTPAGRLAALLLVFAMTVILPASLTGQREQLALIVALPYAALIARRRAGVVVAPVLAVGVAVLASYGFALKHYFIAVPVLLEAWLMLHYRARWRPWRPELMVLAGLALAYAAAVVILAPAFFTVMLPMVDTAYFGSQQTLLFTLVKPYVLFWVVAGLFLWLTRREPSGEANPVADAAVPALLLAWLGFALGYVLQSRGWNYHSIAATGAIGTAVGIRALRMRAWPGRAVSGAILAGLILVMYPYRPERAPEDALLDRVAPGEGVFVAGFDASANFRRGRENLVWVSRTYSLWMVGALAKAEAEGRTSPALAALEAQVLAAVSQDIRCNPPQLIVMQATPGVPGRGGDFSFDEFLLRDAALRRFIAEHYAPARGEPIGAVYWRRGPVPRGAEPACRSIR